MLYLLSVVPIIIPSDPAVRAEVAADLATFAEWLVLGCFLMCVFQGFLAIAKGIIRLVRFIVKSLRKEH